MPSEVELQYDLFSQVCPNCGSDEGDISIERNWGIPVRALGFW
jgi:hypothetical protein